MFSEKRFLSGRRAWIVWLALGLVLIVGATAWGQPGQGQCCYPPPGQYRFPTIGHIEATFGATPVQLDLLGPTMVQAGTPTPAIPTEMVALQLTGMSPIGGAVDGHLIPGTNSTGQTMGTQSFFDVFFEIELAQAPWAGGQRDTVYVGNPGRQYIPVHVINDSLRCFPPQSGARWCTQSPPFQLPLTSRRLNNQVGVLTLVWHTVLPQNHYKTWKVFDLAPPVTRTVVAKDQFMQDNLTLDSILYLSNPVRKDTFNIADTTYHFTWYRVKQGRDTLLSVEFENQFQRDTILIDSAKYFLLPTQKFPHNPPKLLDHYKAYRIRNPQAFTRQVILRDQFDLSGPENINLLVPRYFLTPARKNAEPVYDTLTHFVAYEINPKRLSTQNRGTLDQFGNHTIRIDSSVYVLVPTCKLKVQQPCIPGTPDCNSVTTDPCLLVCPKSDVIFKVTVKDNCGNPICDPNLWLDFSGVPCAIPCPGEEPLWPIVKPDSCNPATGIHYFTVDAGALVQNCTNCRAFLFVNGAFCRNIPVRFFDVNADLCVTAADQTIVSNCIFLGACPPDPLCLDYNCDGVLSPADMPILGAHVSHCCPTPPPPPSEPNHYKTWRIAPQTFQRTVFVHDQFVNDSLRLVAIEKLSNPVRKIVPNPFGGADTFNIVDPDDHLTWYRAFGKNLQRDVEFRNQFERDTVRIDSVQYLLLPTQKSPHPPADSLDHYKAYRIKNPHELLVPVELQDQFDVLAPENINTLIQRYFLTPARKNNELRYDTVTHYLAYEIFPKRTSSEVRQTADQFGTHVLQVQNSELLLVPTTKIAFCPCDMGDLNCDAILTSADVVLHLNRTFLGIGQYPPCVPDLNCDGILTSADVVLLLNMTYLGLPPGC